MRFLGLLFLPSFLLASQFDLAAQTQNNVWAFGHHAGLDFNTAPPTPFESELYTLEGNASISDNQGTLLFYTDGDTVWDKSHEVMPNGFGLLGGESSSQAALIVPIPDSQNKYYVFTTGDFIPFSGLQFSVVDMFLNDGYGDVIAATKNTLLLDFSNEMLTAILHSNGKDIWILSHKVNTNEFYAYLITETGLSANPVISSIGSIYQPTGEGSFPGQIHSSHNGLKIVSAITYKGICEMFDFDAATGMLTNYNNLQPLIDDQNVYGIEFSPNDSLVYLAGFSEISDSNFVRQVSFLENPPQVHTVASYPGVSEEFGSLQMGPDKKIYLARRFRNFVGVFHSPNLISSSCQYEEGGLYLTSGTLSTYGLPNPAPYSFCPNITIPKDTTICFGDSLRLAIDLNSSLDCPQSYIWYDGTTDTVKTITKPGIYWLEVNNSFTVYYDTIIVDSAVHRTFLASVCEGESYEGYEESGMYVDTFLTIKGCDSIRTLQLTVILHFRDTIESSICYGDTMEGYTQSGIYIDTFPNEDGCLSIRTLNLTVIHCTPVITYSLDACESVMANGSHMDYSEFTPAYPNLLSCAEISADLLTRVFPEKHSCTIGINGSPAMCITVFDSCGYDAGNDASVIIKFTIDPASDSMVQLTGFEFYEKGPLDYAWINGPGGINNFPYYFGMRILKNGTEIYRRKIIPTHLDWTLQKFDFTDIPIFKIDSVTDFQIELLPYCPAFRHADVSVWDLDEIRIYAGCISPSKKEPVIHGIVTTIRDQPINNVIIQLSPDALFEEKESRITKENGSYVYEHLVRDKGYFLKGFKNDDVRNGISTLDLIWMQKHLLGIEPFKTLDQYVAADINRSGSISVVDLIELQKFILGKYTAFPQNTSWRFGVSSQDFTGKDLGTFQEIKNFERLSNDDQEANFFGIKIGDLNGNVSLNASNPKIVNRSSSYIPFLVNDQRIIEGQPLTLTVSIGAETRMTGFQLALDLRHFELLQILPGIVPVSEENYFLDKNGSLRLSWIESPSFDVSPGSKLFNLVLIPKISGFLKDLILLADDYMSPEFYINNDITPTPIKLKIVEIPASVNNDIQFQIEPNPFQTSFQLRFYLDHKETIIFRLYDINGIEFFELEKIYTQGEQVENINVRNFQALQGIIYCQLISNGNISIQKAVKLN
ncbi:MAG: hypothetical protein ABIQ02_10470 [Saprospiraceae bacterium]